jgi:signal peptidase II
MKKERIIIVALGIVLFILDRMTKILLLKGQVTNTGVFFGLFQGYNSFFIIVSIIVSAFLIIFSKRSSFRTRIFVTFILIGIFSNLLDRIFFGNVIDFIHLGSWPVFNLADIFILIGVIGGIVSYIREWQ